MKPTPYDETGRADEPPLYLRLVRGVDDAAKLIIVDADGEPVPGGNVLVFKRNGQAIAACSIDRDAARRAGIKVDDEGMLEIES